MIETRIDRDDKTFSLVLNSSYRFAGSPVKESCFAIANIREENRRRKVNWRALWRIRCQVFRCSVNVAHERSNARRNFCLVRHGSLASLCLSGRNEMKHGGTFYTNFISSIVCVRQMHGMPRAPGSSFSYSTLSSISHDAAPFPLCFSMIISRRGYERDVCYIYESYRSKCTRVTRALPCHSYFSHSRLPIAYRLLW